MLVAMASMEEVREFWDREASSFDKEPDHGLRDPMVRQAWADLMTRLLPEAPARVADLGSGTGSLSVLLASQGYEVTAVDLSPGMIAAAQHKAATAGVEIDFRLGDAANPELASRSFDVVLCRHVLWALPDPGAALRRWRQLLKPEGTVVMVEGRWSTGAGLTASELRTLVSDHATEVTIEALTDRGFWGKQISDERYAMVVGPH
jgi:2-polyprenyl-3-methyl-5-hydroxy-6-metoxy-1,4-benzoquinol methylase